MPSVLSPSLLCAFRPLAIDLSIPPDPAVFFMAPNGTTSVPVGETVPPAALTLLRSVHDEVKRRSPPRQTAKINGVEISYDEGGIGPKMSLRPEKAEAGCRQARVLLSGMNMVYGTETLWMPHQLEIRRSRASMEGLFTAIQELTFQPDAREPVSRTISSRRSLVMAGFQNEAMRQLSWETLSKDPLFRSWMAVNDRVGGAVSNRSQGDRLRVTRETRVVTIEWEMKSSRLPEAVQSRWDFILE